MATNRRYDGDHEFALDYHVRALLQQPDTAAASRIDADANVNVIVAQYAQLKMGNAARVDAIKLTPGDRV
ncbi:hypothetical protein SARC_03900 [Sphaeroforma arctica JP610]|uniref:Uncharacterized protein n=1 Tax=Sphaeroforma arctica JP610 TaxID=667725 RepID=A0A0L0G493_9EUKA|nr:hypothetical protein SARC_03900 [Sphaeroforma arctica JP610]KNC83875.1 hypothetical protein SARC_03900 [Sphaeroforma arctica JP610]|eukprot:XP_014157777.1 hypothetical protein SARC_03900 [Sphaeroforma arctica JP610]